MPENRLLCSSTENGFLLIFGCPLFFSSLYIFFSFLVRSVDIDWCHYRHSLVQLEDGRSLCSAVRLSVNLWVWPSFLACVVCKVGVGCVQTSLITSVPLRASCHHYTLTCPIYKCAGTFEYSITYMQMILLCPELWLIWVCNRCTYVNTYIELWTNRDI